MKTEEFLSTADVARLAGVHRTTVNFWYKRGRLKGKIGRAKNLEFHHSVVKAFLAARKPSGKALAAAGVKRVRSKKPLARH